LLSPDSTYHLLKQQGGSGDSFLALHLLQICMVYVNVNTLLVQKVLEEKEWLNRMQPEDFWVFYDMKCCLVTAML
jgi:hypothetical protein